MQSGSGIMDQPIDAAGPTRGAEPSGGPERIDAGAEIEDLLLIQSSPLGQLAQVSAVSSAIVCRILAKTVSK